jgi:hypothetical protein
MAIAEAGATRYVDFLNNNRGLIPYSACVTQDATTGACSDTASAQSWYGVGQTASTASTTSIPNIAPSPSTTSTSTSCDSSSSSANLPSNYQTDSSSSIADWAKSATTGSNIGWKDLPNGTGQYRLVSYIPTGITSTTSGSAKLIVEGRANQTGTETTATENVNTGKARIEITIPASPNSASSGSGSGSGFPGLWARDFKINKVSIYSNVRDSSQCLTNAKSISTTTPISETSTYIEKVPDSPLVVTSTKKNTGAGNDNLYQKTNAGIMKLRKQGFPSLPNGGTYAAPSTTGTPQTANALSCPYSGQTDSKGKSVPAVFPRKDDYDTTGKQYGSANPPQLNATYVYVVCSSKPGNAEGKSIDISSNDGVTLGISGQEKFKFYLGGSMILGGSGNFEPLSGTNTQIYIAPAGYLDIGAGGNVGLVSAPSALQLYVYATDNGFASGSNANAHAKNTTTQTQSVRLGGNGSFYGFVFAPNANALMGGTEDVAGALWAKSIEIGGDGKVWQALFNTTGLDVTLPDSSYTTYNLGGSPTAWKRVQVN